MLRLVVVSFVGAAVAVPIAAPHASAGTTITVNVAFDDFTNNGNCTLREAIAAANTDAAVDACPAGSGDDVISLPLQQYILSIPGTGENGDLTGDLDVTANVRIVDTAFPSGGLITATGIDRVIEVRAGATVTLSRLTIQDGLVVNNDVSTGSGFMGGGIYNAGTLTLEDSTVTKNQVDFGNFGGGSGAGIGNDGTLTLNRSRVVNNSMGNTYPAGTGGGIANRGTVSINQSTVSGNMSWQGGGGIYNTGKAFFVQSTVSGNHGGCFECPSVGGGIYNGGTLRANNTTISFNSMNAGDYSSLAAGGGIYNDGVASVNNVTITSNNVTHLCDTHCFTKPTGGGVSAPQSFVAENTIIAGNTVTENQSAPNGGGSVTTASDCDGTVFSGGYNLVTTTAGCTYGSMTGDKIGVDPKLGKLQGNGGLTFTQNPNAGSPAIDAGNPATPGSGNGACQTGDQRGLPRADDGDLNGEQRCDIGAVEAAAIDSASYRMRFDGWTGVTDAKASGGGYRTANAAGQTVNFSQGTSAAVSSFALQTFKGSNMGKVAVSINGVSKGTVDLYAPGAPVRATITFTATATASPNIQLSVLGTKNAASTGTEVRVDGFKLGSLVVDDLSQNIAWSRWVPNKNGRDLNGSLRSAGAGATVSFDTIGPVLTMVVFRQSGGGSATVTVDGVAKGVVNFASTNDTWLARQTFSGLGAGQHHVVVTVQNVPGPFGVPGPAFIDGVTLR